MDKIVLPIVSANQIMSWGPCRSYSKERVEGLVGEGLDALGILELDILAPDRLWAILRPEMIPEPILGGLGCDYAMHVLPIYEILFPDDPRPRRAIGAMRKHLRGEIDGRTLAAAHAGARDAYLERGEIRSIAAAAIDATFDAISAAHSVLEAAQAHLPAAAWAAATQAAGAVRMSTGGTTGAWSWIAARTRVVLSHTTGPEARSQSKSDEARASIT